MTMAAIDTITGPASLEHLLQKLADSSHRNFILIIHGYEDGSGLTLDLSHTHRSTTDAKADHFHLQRLMDLDNPLNQLPRAEERKLGLSQAGIDHLLRLMNRVRQRRIDCIEFRACNLGRNPMSLERFRKFLGPRVVGAPDLHSFFGQGPVAIGRDRPRSHNHGRDQSWEIYKFPNALMPPNLVSCFAVSSQNKPTGGHVVADDAVVLDAWIKKFIKADGAHSGGDMPIHGLWVTGRQIFLEAEDVANPLGSWGGPPTRRPIFPLSENYAKHIVYAR
jgi:hypothetical protein